MAGSGSETGTGAVAGGGGELAAGEMTCGAAEGAGGAVSGSLAGTGGKAGGRFATDRAVVEGAGDSPRREKDGGVERSVVEMRSGEVGSVGRAGDGAGEVVDDVVGSGIEGAGGGSVGRGCRNGGGLGRERRRTVEGPSTCAVDAGRSEVGGGACGRGGRSGIGCKVVGAGTGGGTGSARSPVGRTTRSNAEQVPAGMGGALGCGAGLGSAGGLVDFAFAASRR